MSSRKVYLDYNATTPIDPSVLERMVAVLRNDYGNPSSRHSWGADAAKLVEEARQHIADLINAKPRQIYFTSGATESNNLILRGILPHLANASKTVVSTKIEHESVAAPLKSLEALGWAIRYVPVDQHGVVRKDVLSDCLKGDEALYAEIGAHNEFGTIQPIKEHAAILAQKGVRYFLDGAQIVGKIPFDVKAVGADFLSFSAHKFYGPKGIGAVFVKDRPEDASACALLQGGGQEHELRSGTLNVPAIVGFGEAARIAKSRLNAEAEQILGLRNRLWTKLRDGIPGIQLNGSPDDRIPGNLNFTVPGIEANAVLNLVSSLGISTGSACNADSVTPSPSLLAIGLSEQDAFSTLRICIGRFTTKGDVDFAADEIGRAFRLLDNAKI